MLCAIWCYLYNLKNVKTHMQEGYFQASAYNFTKSNTALWVFGVFHVFKIG